MFTGMEYIQDKSEKPGTAPKRESRQSVGHYISGMNIEHNWHFLFYQPPDRLKLQNHALPGANPSFVSLGYGRPRGDGSNAECMLYARIIRKEMEDL